MANHDHGPESNCGLRCPAIEPPIDLEALESHVKAAIEQRLVGRQVAWTSSPELVLGLITQVREVEHRLAESDERNSNLFDLANKHLDIIDRVKALADAADDSGD